MILKHYRHFRLAYRTSFKRHFSSVVLVIFILVLIIIFTLHQIAFPAAISRTFLPISDFALAAFASLFRLIAAYILALVFGIPMALLMTGNSKLERIFLPIFDVIQSIPVLAFFPIIVLVFLNFNFFEGAAIFIIFLDMVWNLVFSMVGGLKTIPADVELAAKVFKASALKKLWHVTLPAILPSIITGSLLAWGQGWNILIVAEVLHNYIPGATASSDLLGLGSLIVNAINTGRIDTFLISLAILIILIGTLNFFVWQKLLHLVERFKFD
jgi:NitT/TauT family transport system permease protein